MGLILWILFGALAGWIASKIAGTDAQQGWILNIVMGIVGALVGGFIWNRLIKHTDSVVAINLPGLIIAILGALIVTFAVGKLTGKKI
ncbi:MAG: GlsB/YeaQ/YmgE family stress response membrane protein [Thermomicrobiales bacterium]